MSLKCKECGSRNTETVSAKELSDKTGIPSIMTGAKGFINPTLVVGTLSVIFEALGKLFGWLEEDAKGNRKVTVCKDCGHWEKI